MRVVFKTLTIQNLLSFGNNETKIDFTHGLNLITGSNGAGKSSALLDAISFALFDKPYRKINKSELINRKNKKNLLVVCEFSIDNTVYLIKRGLKNKDVDLEFHINGTPQKLLSSRALNQTEIERHIGIDYKLFKQIISLSIAHNSPFLTLTAGEKRELLEKFSNTAAIAKMLKYSKEEAKALKIKRDMLIDRIDLLGDHIKSEKVHITELTASKKTFDQDKKQEVFELNEKIDLESRNLKQLKADGRDKTAELKKIVLIDIKLIRDLKDETLKIKTKSEFEISAAKKILDALDGKDVCPNCNSKLTEEHKSQEISLQKSIIKKAEKNKKSAMTTISEINQKIQDGEDINDDAKDLRYEINLLKKQIMDITTRIEHNKAEKKKVKDREFVVDLKKMKDEYNKKVTEYKDAKVNLEAINKKTAMFKKIVEMLSDSGVKSYIFEQLIPVLNKSINHYLNIFDLPIYIEFDNSMSDNIKTTANFNKPVSYYTFSEGEKKKIDMAILLSFIDVTKKVTNWTCNLLIIDELLDSSIDEHGLEKLLQSLDKMVADDNNFGIYIISHRFKAEYKPYFNNMIEVKKNADGFSKITKL